MLVPGHLIEMSWNFKNVLESLIKMSWNFKNVLELFQDTCASDTCLTPLTPMTQIYNIYFAYMIYLTYVSKSFRGKFNLISVAKINSVNPKHRGSSKASMCVR